MKQTQSRRRFRKKPMIAALLIAVLAVIWAERSASRLLFSYGEHAAAAKAQMLFAAAVGEMCETEDFSAAVSFQEDESGNVKALSSNTALQNALQSKLATALCTAFEQSDRASFSVPIGTLLGDSFSSGRGPSVTFYTALAASPTVTLSDDFSSAGINQTYHTVTAKATIELLITALGKTRSVTLSLSVPVSQTVIAGDVPWFYAAF